MYLGTAMWYATATIAFIRSLGALAKARDSDPITDDSFFYGQSPPIYPSPPQSGRPPWTSAHTKAHLLISQMTLPELANVTFGYPASISCPGITGSVPRLKFPGLALLDAENGVRGTDFVNGWPSSFHLGASWNRELVLESARAMGKEFRKKGAGMVLGPVVGPLGRVARGGRNWEGYGNDPYLSGQLATKAILGIQEQGVMASVKHYIANEQETNRNPEGNISAISSNIDDKTMHELYLWPFADAVHAGATSVMSSYNRINNSYACQNSYLLNGLLKTELGFEGIVVSDWNGNHASMASAEAGLDLTMPLAGPWGEHGSVLVEAVRNGSMNISRLEDMATRIVAAWYQMGQDENYPSSCIGMPEDFQAPKKAVYARDPASKHLLLQGAMEGHVLVKNVNKSLPLKEPKLLSVFGYDAAAPAEMNVPSGARSPWTLGLESVDLKYYEAKGYMPQIADQGTLIMGGGSGANAPAYISAPFDAIQQQAYEDNTSLFWDFKSIDPAVDSNSDACLVFINAFSTEAFDRPGLRDDYSDTLIQNIASKCANTIVTIHNAGIRPVDTWIEHPNITAVVFAHLPGQDSGRALVRLLYGHTSFSGKLPNTVAENESDINVLDPDMPDEEGNYKYFPQSDFAEGVMIDHRDFDKKELKPRFEFGFGLSYTTFEYSDLRIEIVTGADISHRLSEEKEADVEQGGSKALWDILAVVTAEIENTGEMDAAEVAQLYIHIPGEETVKILRGFEKVFVKNGKREKVKFDLRRRDLSKWRVEEHAWVLGRGEYEVWVGRSSRDLNLNGKVSFNEERRDGGDWWVGMERKAGGVREGVGQKILEAVKVEV